MACAVPLSSTCSVNPSPFLSGEYHDPDIAGPIQSAARRTESMRKDSGARRYPGPAVTHRFLRALLQRFELAEFEGIHARLERVDVDALAVGAHHEAVGEDHRVMVGAASLGDLLAHQAVALAAHALDAVGSLRFRGGADRGP